MSRILLSAYACEPGKGSEPEVGWRWAIELARLGHEVTVLTRANNRAALEAALPATGLAERVHLATYDLPRWASFWKRGRRGVHIYYLLWQWLAARLAERLHRAHRFDRVHHATFVSLRQPSFLGRLGVPFVFGPVSGGEAIPWRLRGGRGPRAFLVEVVRDLANALVRVEPLMARTFAAAETIVVTSTSSRALVPRRFRAKTRISLAIGIDPEAWTAASPGAGTGPLRLLFVGRLVGFKALDLALEAVAAARAGGVDLRFTVVGDGPLAGRWRADGVRLGLDGVVTWLPWRPRAELARAYAAHDALLFPSLRDVGQQPAHQDGREDEDDRRGARQGEGAPQAFEREPEPGDRDPKPESADSDDQPGHEQEARVDQGRADHQRGQGQGGERPRDHRRMPVTVADSARPDHRGRERGRSR